MNRSLAALPLFALLCAVAVAAAAEQTARPELTNYTPFQSALQRVESTNRSLDGKDRNTYYSLLLTAHFAIESDGALRLVGDAGAARTAPDCAAERGLASWVAATHVRVSGGKLEQATAQSGAAIATHTLAEADVCGGVRAATWDLDGYLPADAHVLVHPTNAAPLELRLPQPFVPFVLLRYHSGAMIPTPLRIVEMDVDLGARRVDMLLQSTFGAAAPLRKIEARGIFPGASPAADETPRRFAERTRATISDLAACAPPRGRPIEPCSDPQRIPNLLIFSPDPRDTDALRADYVTRVQSAVQQGWLRPEGTKAGLLCTVHIKQKPDGSVLAVTFDTACNADAATRKSLKRAVQLASPLPHEGFEAVFAPEVDLVFRYDE